jgi:hypothetical protein
VLERVLVAIAGLATPLVGLALQASRRQRLVDRIRTYTELAKEFEESEAETARGLRRLAKKTAGRLIETEEASLDRQFEPIAVVAFFLLAAPGLAGLLLLWPLDEWWRWVLIIASALWVLLIAAVTKEQLWKPNQPSARQHKASSNGVSTRPTGSRD